MANNNFLPLSPSPSPPSAAHHLFATEQDAAAGMHHPYPAHAQLHPSLLYASASSSSSSMASSSMDHYGSYSNPLTLLPCDGEGVGQGAVTGGKRYRSAPPKTFQCAGYGECRMVFSRSEHLARHIRKHTGERPFACHCTKQFSRLDNLRQHAQTVHSAPEDKPLNERMMRALAGVNASMMAGVRGRRRFGDSSPHSPHSPQLSHLPHLASAPMAFSRDGEVYTHGQGQEQPLPSPPYSASASGFAWNAPPPASTQGHPSFPPGAFSTSSSSASPSSASASASGSGSASPPFAYDGASGSPMPSPSLFGSFADVNGGASPYPSPGAFYAQQQQSPYDVSGQGQAQDYMSAGSQPGQVRVKQEDVGLDLDGFYAALEGTQQGHGLSSYASSGSLSSLSSRSSASSLSSASEEGEEEERPETAHPPERASWQGQQQQGRPIQPVQQQQQQRGMGQRRLQLQQRGGRQEYLPSPPESPSFYGVGATSTYSPVSASQHPSHQHPSQQHPSQHSAHLSQHQHAHAHHTQRQTSQDGGPFGWTLDDASPSSAVQCGGGGAGEMSNAQYYAALQQAQAQAQAQSPATYASSPYPSPHQQQQQGGGQEGYFYGAGGMGGGGGGMGGQGGYAVFA
ncbi:hypothetical protein DFH06DRAFT_28 [Mycena polygramma]|nr:hypothetical protein DFH06DRAFT_28 [Mycena polygramma]